MSAESRESLLAAALAYAERGIPVFPVKPGGKAPLIRRGFLEASTDADQIRTWWAKWPDANVGIPTGRGSGFDVLDVDVKTDGLASLEKLMAAAGFSGGYLNDYLTPSAKTGGGGRHYCFRATGITKSKATAFGLKYPGIDVKGEGGYIVAAPSVHESGIPYAWVEDRALPELPPRPWPPEILALLVTGPAHELPRDRRAQGSDDGLTGVTEGSRNDSMVEWVGRWIRQGLSIEQVLLMASSRNLTNIPPLPDKTVADIVERIWAVNQAKPAQYRLNDDGNGKRFAARYAGQVGYSPHVQTWLIFNGRQWVDDVGETTVLQMAKQLVESWFDEAKTLSEEKAQKMRRHAVACGSAAKLRATLFCAQSEPAMVVDISTFDGDDWVLNCPNGALDLKSFTLRSGEARDRCRLMTAIDYDANATDPQFDRFLAENLPTRETREFCQEMNGYMLTGDRWLEIMLAAFGPSRSGKTTWAELARKALGSYARAIQPETFMESRRDNGGEANRPVLASLVGKRLVTSPESGKAHRLDIGLVKQVVGGDPVTAAAKYKDPFTYTPKFVWLLYGNHRPKADFDEDALRRRIVELPFRIGHSDTEADESLKTYLLNNPAAQRAWLAWAVKGLQRLMREKRGKLSPPAEVRASIADYWAEQDTLGPFLSLLVFEADAFVTSADLDREFQEWVRDTETKVTKADLNIRLVKAGCVNKTRRIAERGGEKPRGWVGVRFADEAGTLGRAGTPESGKYSRETLYKDFPETGVPRRPSVPPVRTPPLYPSLAERARAAVNDAKRAPRR